MIRLDIARGMMLNKSLLGVWLVLCGSGALAQAGLSEPEELRALVGRIEGLDGHGLVLVDGLGSAVRPTAGASGFSFHEGRPYIKPMERVQLSVARQPAGQTCRVVAGGGDDQSDPQQAMVHCVPALPSPMTMRDCFQVLSSGASFRLGRRVDGQWLSYADVTMDPVGINRLHHQTTIDGRVVLDTITFLPDDRPRAVIEVRVLGAVLPGQMGQTTGDHEGMPLDLSVGEARSYSIQPQQAHRSSQPAPHTAKRRWVKLVGVGPLDTRAGTFPVACHLQEWWDASAEDARVWDVWYAPGYGPVRILSANDASASPFSLEVMEVLRRPR